jgi:hypothetical protein
MRPTRRGRDAPTSAHRADGPGCRKRDPATEFGTPPACLPQADSLEVFIREDAERFIEVVRQVDAAIDRRYVLVVGAKDANPSAVCRLLRHYDAPATCHVISADDSELDEQELDLEEALAKVFDFSQATIISCIPGKLAYFEGDWHTHWILKRTR